MTEEILVTVDVTMLPLLVRLMFAMNFETPRSRLLMFPTTLEMEVCGKPAAEKERQRLGHLCDFEGKE